MNDWFQNLTGGLRLLLPLQLRMEIFQPGLRSIGLSLLASILIIAGFDYQAVYGPAYFDETGAAILASNALLLLCGAFVVTQLHGVPQRLLLLLTILTSALPWYLLISYSVRHFMWYDSGIYQWMLLGLWGLAAQIRAVHLCLEERPAGAWTAPAVASALVFLVVGDPNLVTTVFYSFGPESAEQTVFVDQEFVYYQQEELLEDKLGQLLPQRAGKSDVYFVGFAGTDEDTVFRTEVDYVRQLADRQFGTAGRSLKLFSDVEHLETEPLANTYNLRTVLNGIGRIMDPHDDVLFLFLTSHGSEDATLYVSQRPFFLKSLSAPDLREALDAAGIQWRIIVVSACYSGGFIEPLQTDQTLVMSASASDKNSFGCSSDRDLTYFGEAFFQNQLSSSRNLLASFEAARQEIAARELAEELTPSEPQFFIGEAMREKLKALWPADAAH